MKRMDEDAKRRRKGRQDLYCFLRTPEAKGEEKGGLITLICFFLFLFFLLFNYFKANSLHSLAFLSVIPRTIIESAK